MKHIVFTVVVLLLAASLPAFAAATFEVPMHLGQSNGTINLGKCPDTQNPSVGNCIGVIVHAPMHTHIVSIQRKLGSSEWVHSCDPHEQFGTANCKANVIAGRIGTSAYRYVPRQPRNTAEWLGWTPSGNPSEAYTLVVSYESGD